MLSPAALKQRLAWSGCPLLWGPLSVHPLATVAPWGQVWFGTAGTPGPERVIQAVRGKGQVGSEGPVTGPALPHTDQLQVRTSPGTEAEGIRRAVRQPLGGEESRAGRTGAGWGATPEEWCAQGERSSLLGVEHPPSLSLGRAMLLP